MNTQAYVFYNSNSFMDHPPEGLTEQQVNELQYAWQGVYLHGQAEELEGFDLTASSRGLPAENGVYKAVVQGKKALLFFWRLPQLVRGLVVICDDKESVAHAMKSMLEQRIRL